MEHFSILGLGESLKNFSPNGSVTIGVNDIYKHFPADYVVCVDTPDKFNPERFKTITSSYYKGSHGIIVTYDITDRDSFAKISEWMAEVDRHANKNICKIVI